MKKLLIIFCGLVICLAAVAAPKKKSGKIENDPAKVATATVGYIVDGDTFAAVVMLADEIEITVRVRIIDIDAPEMKGECDREIKMANQARERLGELIPVGSTVQLSGVKDDKYLGRIDAHVKSAAGANVSEVLIREGLVRPYNGGKRQPWCTSGDQLMLPDPAPDDSDSGDDNGGWMPAPVQQKIISVIWDTLK